MNLKESIRKILKEEFDNLNWADELSGAENGWDLISQMIHSKDFLGTLGKEGDSGVEDPRVTFLNNEYRVMLKVRDFNYLTFSFEACGMDYPSISDIESEYYEIIEINNLKRGFVDCDSNRDQRFGYPNDIVDAVLLSNSKIFGFDEEFWFIPQWADLILIPKK
jgi:hypothetical protein